MITLEGNCIEFNVYEVENNTAEVIDLENKVLFKGRIVEATCENHTNFRRIQAKYKKVVLDNYTAEPLPEGYFAKKTIKNAIENIYINNDDLLYIDMDENVDVIYDALKERGVLK